MSPGIHKMANGILLINKVFYLRGGTRRYCFDVTRLLQQNGHSVTPVSMAHRRYCPASDIPPQGSVL